jgi:hypothetical protein
VSEEQLTEDPLPLAKWDIKMTGAVTPAGFTKFDNQQTQTKIYWDALSADRIRKITPLRPDDTADVVHSNISYFKDLTTRPNPPGLNPEAQKTRA